MIDWTTIFTPIVAFLAALRAPVAGLLLAAGGCLMGCEGSGKDGGITTMDAQKFLEDGKFKGKGRWSQGGAPLSVGQKTVFWIGPESALFEFDGSFDFSDPTAAPPPPTGMGAKREAAQPK